MLRTRRNQRIRNRPGIANTIPENFIDTVDYEGDFGGDIERIQNPDTIKTMHGDCIHNLTRRGTAFSFNKKLHR